jgi:hypothetical protein
VLQKELELDAAELERLRDSGMIGNRVPGEDRQSGRLASGANPGVESCGRCAG